MSEIKLKPCPFCGGEAVIVSTGTGLEQAGYVQCGQCCARSGFFLGDKYKERSTKAWNKRYEPPTVSGGILVPFGNARFKK